MANIEQVASAFVAGRKASCGNASTDGTVYVLRATTIARRLPSGCVKFNWGGYHTVTTANHMRHIRDALGSGYEYTGLPGAFDPFSRATARDNGLNEFTLVPHSARV